MKVSTTIKFILNPSLYLRDPEDTELGQKIIGEGIRIMATQGYEAFNFKKLAENIHSTEASVYRYFNNKHQFLAYLISWYFSWIEYKISQSIADIDDHELRLKTAIKILSQDKSDDKHFPHIYESGLREIINREASKVFLTTEVEEEKGQGYYNALESICVLLSTLILNVNGAYKYPRALGTLIINETLRQRFFSNHLQFLTELQPEPAMDVALSSYLEHIVFKLVR